MPTPTCLFGAESEYAVAAATTAGPVSQQKSHRAFMNAARAALAHIPDTSRSHPGMFLENGGRLYWDLGFKIEYSTPEVTTPTALVRYVRAGDAIMAQVRRHFELLQPEVTDVLVSRTAVDAFNRTAWGAHESYLLRRALSGAAEQALLPFLVTRIVIAGGGGFDADSAGLRFLVSPRTAFVTHLSGQESMKNRPLLDRLHKPLAAAPYRRFHLMCGDPLMSDWALYVRTGATALVLRLVEVGLGPDLRVDLEDPLSAFRVVSADPSCRRSLLLSDGRRLTAIELQRIYLEAVRNARGALGLPAWTDDLCNHWQAALDGIEGIGAICPANTLDWPMKYAAYTRVLRTRGFEWPRLEILNPVLDALKRDLQGTPHRDIPMSAELFSTALTVPAIHRRLKRRLGIVGATAEEAKRLLDCRAELFAVDLLWGEIGRRGVFDALAAQGVLTHHVTGCEDVPAAMHIPPADTRAWPRGRAVARLAADRSVSRGAWDHVDDMTTGQRLDLSDPFQSDAGWTTA